MTLVQTGEAVFLAQMMAQGEPQPYPFKFTDPKHQTIYEMLSHLQRMTYHPGPAEIIQYLNEFGHLDMAGGPGYINAVFRGAV
jgi:replicative DNA helicase